MGIFLIYDLRILIYDVWTLDY